MSVQREFERPPECPVFRPSAEEFEDPLRYLAAIRAEAEPHGICKIIPPASWRPRVALDTDSFRFRTRVQKLNEIEASARQRTFFLEGLFRWHTLQGNDLLRVPTVCGRPLDLYGLNALVKENGGFDSVCENRLWRRLTLEMGLGDGAPIKQHYQRYLQGYDQFIKDREAKEAANATSIKQEPGDIAMTDVKHELDVTEGGGFVSKKHAVSLQAAAESADRIGFGAHNGHDMAASGAVNPLAIREGDTIVEARDGDDFGFGSRDAAAAASRVLAQDELKRAAPTVIKAEPDAVPKADPEAGTEAGAGQEQQTSGTDSDGDVTMGGDDDDDDADGPSTKRLRSVGDEMCCVCGSGDRDEEMLLCDGCGVGTHMFCLSPPITQVPPGDWFCATCTKKRYEEEEEEQNMGEEFGFAESSESYSLTEFKKRSDVFKAQYFRRVKGMVGPISEEDTEAAFWELVQDPFNEVTVEYGSDLHSSRHGSAFPTLDTAKSATDQTYAHSGWNLNNLSVLRRSVLRYVKGDISGMISPWVYVGMTFSAFAFHAEDHFTPSINYCHMGAAKTWYGIPGSQYARVEEVMREVAPTLFAKQPDLILQLLMLVNPTVLMEKGVSVVRTDQQAGEFVVTFPAAFHGGFNQGFNVAEAVNFAPAEWLEWGRRCLGVYRHYRRKHVFSHEELLCRIAQRASKADYAVCQRALGELESVLADTRRHMATLQGKHVRREFDMVPDDDRECVLCHATCFIVATRCACKPRQYACPDHATELCSTCPPENREVHFHFTCSEIEVLIGNISKRIRLADQFRSEIHVLLDPANPKPSGATIDAFLDRARDLKLVDLDEVCELKRASRRLFQFDVATRTLLARINRHETRNIRSGTKGRRISISEIEDWIRLRDELPAVPSVTVPQRKVLSITQNAQQMQEVVNTLLAKEDAGWDEMADAVAQAGFIGVELHRLDDVRDRLARLEWVRAAERHLREPSEQPSTAAAGTGTRTGASASAAAAAAAPAAAAGNSQRRMTLTSLSELLLRGQRFEHPLLGKVQKLMETCQEWRGRALAQLSQPTTQEALKGLLAEVDHVVHLDEIDMLEDAIERADALAQKVDQMLAQINNPAEAPVLLKAVVPLVKGEEFVASAAVHELRQHYEACLKWGRRVARTFFKDKNKSLTAVIISGASRDTLGQRGIKKKSKDQDNQVYCLCRKPASGKMVACETCPEWFHSRCVDYRSTKGSAELDRFVCPNCRRTERPQFETLVELLQTGHKLRVVHPDLTGLVVVHQQGQRWRRECFEFVEHVHKRLPELRELPASSFPDAVTVELQKLSLLARSLDAVEASFPTDLLALEKAARALRYEGALKIPLTPHGFPKGLYCYCMCPARGFMVECDHCRIWYHGECVSLDEADAESIGEYACPFCVARGHSSSTKGPGVRTVMAAEAGADESDEARAARKAKEEAKWEAERAAKRNREEDEEERRRRRRREEEREEEERRRRRRREEERRLEFRDAEQRRHDYRDEQRRHQYRDEQRYRKEPHPSAIGLSQWQR